jgi:hypothetical protein
MGTSTASPADKTPKLLWRVSKLTGFLAGGVACAERAPPAARLLVEFLCLDEIDRFRVALIDDISLCSVPPSVNGGVGS